MTYKEWQLWGKRPEGEERFNLERVKGNLPEMESTKKLVSLISEVYTPGMKVLDVGCNVGHYLTGLRKKFPELDYTGVDAYQQYITHAKEAFKDDPHAKFEVKDIFEPIFPNEPRDIVYCCNVIQHLPDFRKPVKNLLESTKSICFIRTLLGEKTNIVKSVEEEKFDDEGNPLDYYYINTWRIGYFTDFINNLGWNVEYIQDEYDPKNIQSEFESTKSKHGTRILDGKQVVESIIENWIWIKLTEN